MILKPQYCVEHAPKAHGGDKPDISRADFTWCMTATDWGHSAEETASRVMEESAKAREIGERYALDTALNAAAAVLRRQGRDAAPISAGDLSDMLLNEQFSASTSPSRPSVRNERGKTFSSRRGSRQKFLVVLQRRRD